MRIHLINGEDEVAQNARLPKASIIVLMLLIGAAIANIDPGSIRAQEAVDFNRQIRPLLSDKCWSCHGPDAAAKKIRLRLDSEQASRADLGEGRRAIVPRDSGRSELFRRITSNDDALRMPPAWSGGHRLSDAEIELFKRWIEQGAEWDSHWAFKPPVRPALPKVENAAWTRNGIDNFILSRLEREGLKPQPEADRATLIRRVTLDLTGLPPTPAEVDAFLSDGSPDAYEKLVERLLAGPRYGERMAFKWLDAARYADTNGYQIDGDRSAWRWRDWVIDAFNSNKPYDEFIIEQLAGDLLPKPKLDQVIATAFNRNHRINAEGGIVPEEYAVEYAVDRVDTTSTVFLGLTVGCARCHNHKFDPISQKEYYQLFAYFNSIPEDGRAFDWGNSAPWIQAPTKQQQRELGKLKNDLRIAGINLRYQKSLARNQRRRWERSLTGDPQWFPGDSLLAYVPFEKETGPIFQKSEKAWHNPQIRKAEDKKTDLPPDEPAYRDGTPEFVPSPLGGRAASFDGKVYFDLGRRADLRYKSTSTDFRERFAISLWVNPANADAGPIIAKMPDRAEEKVNGLPRIDGIGLFFMNGKFHFQMVREWDYDGYRSETEQTFAPGKWRHVLITFDGFNQYDDRVSLYIDGQPQKLKVTQPNLYLYWGLPDRPLLLGAGGGMRFKGAMDEVRIYTRIPDREETAALSCADSLARISLIPESRRTSGQSSKIESAWLDTGAPANVKSQKARVDEAKKEISRMADGFPTLMVMSELPKPRQAHILRRGAYDAPGDPVVRGVPSILSPLKADSTGKPVYVDPASNRLDFARWLVDPKNPLTSRVAVNRFWQIFFGAGLVRTVDDFGSQGELPTHPELLDYLAVEFRSGGWNVKSLIRTIVTSATYRQSSRVAEQSRQRDPENRLLSRAPRNRLSAEMIRDQALAVSGLLVERIGGPSVRPYQPDGIYKDMAFSGLTGYEQDKGDGLWRRSLYTFWKRTVLAPNMQVFDASAREFCTVRDTRTNTPLQALNLMNDVTYVEAARFLAQRMMTEAAGDASDRLARGFRLATARKPSGRELEALSRNLESQRRYFREKPEEAARLLAVGVKRNDDSLDRIDLAAFTAVASLILNLDEVITRQ